MPSVPSRRPRHVTWNVNGIRNPFKYAPWNNDKTLQAMFDRLDADIVCFQEVKTPKPSLTDDLVFIPGWDSFYSFPHSQTGYSGVSVYTRDSCCVPTRVEEGVTGVLRAPGTTTRYIDRPADRQIGGYPTERQLQSAAVARDLIDAEGRCLVLDFPLFVLINVYCPARRNDDRTDFRDAFLLALDARVRNLVAAGRHVVLCGDMNTMRHHLDTAAVWGHHGQVLPAEALAFDEDYLSLRSAAIFGRLLFDGDRITNTTTDIPPSSPPILHDACRELHPQRRGMYTCWDTRKNHRPANFGSRIDFVLCSPRLMQLLVIQADIQPQLLGSDHCPVYVVLRDSVDDNRNGQVTHTLHTLDYLNPPGRFSGGQLAMTPAQDFALLQRRQPQSARRMPQFANRQHIGNLFRRAPAAGETAAAGPSSEVRKRCATEGETVREATAATASQPVNPRLPPLLQPDPVATVSEEETGGRHSVASDNEADAVAAAEKTNDTGKTDETHTTSETLSVPDPGHDNAAACLQHATTSHPLRPAVLIPTNSLQQAGSGPKEPIEDGRLARASTSTSSPLPTPTPTPSSFLQLAQAQAKKVKPDSLSKKRSGARSLSLSSSSATSSPAPAPASSTVSPSRPVKKAKTGIQTSISTFLQPRQGRGETAPLGAKTGSEKKAQSQTGPTAADSSRVQPSPDDPPLSAADLDDRPALVPEPEPAPGSESFWAEINDGAMAGWSALGLGQRQSPMCEHGEPCKIFVTRKPGVNSGRSFYMCARPPGPLGRREKGTAWQCTTFFWCRDWKPGRKENE
ncbi:DNA lyase [Grosmannia clavigera kw1407]|uniref:DNA-(apurinic or apyrimidinic site) endonuclease 2 n=2 Tax=Leptographium clavigerum TaxID=226899 RepID=F0XBB2_GROCL|nr:DNA lyase [Grosmannia clavigera kw1407]EFX04950.1 DNA lyase [Grosmannia clavigera kw1407]